MFIGCIGVDDMWQCFSRTVADIVDMCSVDHETFYDVCHPWVDSSVNRALTHKSFCHKLYKCFKDTEHDTVFKSILDRAIENVNICGSMAKARYEWNLFSGFAPGSVKKFYSYCSKVLKSKQNVACLVDRDGSYVTDSFSIAELFSEQFTVQPLAGVSDTPRVHPNVTATLSSVDVHEIDILNYLKELNTNSSPGPDNLSPGLLKNIRFAISKPLSIIFSASLASSALPAAWLCSNVTPVYKNKGSPNVVCNYRPISLTCISLKCLESIICTAICDHLSVNGLTNPYQYGFVKGLSTEVQLLTVLDKWTEYLDRGLCFDVVYVDFSRAFELMGHDQILYRLYQLGISGQILSWLHTYLTNRNQRVKVDGKYSSIAKVNCGVPQGSLLGPLLFLIYVSEIPDLFAGAISVFQYADDTKLFHVIKNLNDCYRLQDSLTLLYDWCNEWGLKFNVCKTRVLHMGNNNLNFAYTVGGERLKVVSEIQDLGIYFSQNLKFATHIKHICKTANYRLYLLRKCFKCSNLDFRIKMYTTYIRPVLEGCSTVWSPYLLKDINDIESVQKRFLRWALPHLPSYDDRLRESKLPSLQSRRTFKDLVMCFKILCLPNYLPNVSNMFTVNVASTRGHNKKLYKHHCKLELRRHFFSFRTVNVWNSLPSHILDSENLSVFKNRLKKFLYV